MKDIKKDVIEIINACEIAFLSTINLENFPETRVLSNWFNRNIDEKLDIYFASHIDSPKFEQTSKNGNASLYYFIDKSMKNMTLFGKVEVVNDKALKDRLWNDELLEYFPGGKEDTLYGVLKFVPTGYKYYDFETDILRVEDTIVPERQWFASHFKIQRCGYNFTPSRFSI